MYQTKLYNFTLLVPVTKSPTVEWNVDLLSHIMDNCRVYMNLCMNPLYGGLTLLSTFHRGCMTYIKHHRSWNTKEKQQGKKLLNSTLC